ENPGEGNDTVIAPFTYTLPDNVENLTLTGSDNLNGYGNALSNRINGNSGDNRLEGYAGDDILNGGPGADVMVGGTGDDTYYVDTPGYMIHVGSGLSGHLQFVPGDQVIENPDEGTDTVVSTFSYTLGDTLENLELQGTDDLDGWGNALDNFLGGNDGANRLEGFA